MIKIPQNLTEALIELESQLQDEEKDKIRNMDEWEFVKLSQIYIGDKLKSQWLRPKDSTLRKYFAFLHVEKVDDMSDIILRSFYRHLKDEDIRYGEQLETKPRYKQPDLS